jgi:hypothetical protein
MTTLLLLFMLSSDVLWRIDLFTAYDIARKPDVVVNQEGEIGILDGREQASCLERRRSAYWQLWQ